MVALVLSKNIIHPLYPLDIAAGTILYDDIMGRDSNLAPFRKLTIQDFF